MEFRAETLKLHVEDVFPKCLWELRCFFLKPHVFFFPLKPFLILVFILFCFGRNFNRFVVPQIALAIGVLTSSIGVRVRRFFGFVLAGAVGQGVVLGVVWCVYWYGWGFADFDSFWGGCRAGCRRRCRLMCVWVRESDFEWFWFVLGGRLAPRFVKEC